MIKMRYIVPTVQLKQVTLDEYRYYEDKQGIRYPSVTSVLQYFYEDDTQYRRALIQYERMLIKAGISPEERLKYTAVRGTIGHYLLTSLLTRQASQPLPEFEVDQKTIDYYNQGIKFFGIPRWALKQDLLNVILMIGKFLYENKITPISNGIEFKILSKIHLYAGTCDILAYFNRRLSLIDIKLAWIKRNEQDISEMRVAKFEAQISAYRESIIEMSDEAIIPQQMLILSFCPDKQFPDNRRILNPNLKYYLYRCKNRFDEFLESRERFKKFRNF